MTAQGWSTGRRNARTPSNRRPIPRSRLMRKDEGQPAKLSYGGQAHGEPQWAVRPISSSAESPKHRCRAAVAAFARRRHIHPRRSPPTRNCHVKICRAPARNAGRPTAVWIGRRPAWMGRTTLGPRATGSANESESAGEIFGWLKTVGGLRNPVSSAERRQMAAFISVPHTACQSRN